VNNNKNTTGERYTERLLASGKITSNDRSLAATSSYVVLRYVITEIFEKKNGSAAKIAATIPISTQSLIRSNHVSLFSIKLINIGKKNTGA
jgi:hypothetical protein